MSYSTSDSALTGAVTPPSTGTPETGFASAEAPIEVSSPPSELPRSGSVLLLASVFVVAACGLIYELIAGSLSTYLLGDSVTQFSLVIGLFLSAMGFGSFLSRFIRRDLVSVFIGVEIGVGIIGGFSALALFFAFALFESYTPLLILLSVAVGTLVGLEIPLLIRILRNQLSLRAVVGNVLSIDYLGALAASLLFPWLLVPYLGLIRSGCLFGLFNVGIALVGLQMFRHTVSRLNTLRVIAIIGAALLVLGLATAGQTTTIAEDMLYDDAILYAKKTPYQRLVLTRWRNDLRLFIDGNIQFSSVDEFRYHESLVHPAMSLLPTPKQVLVLGGGDGMAAREVLKYRSVQSVDLVDLDPEMTRLFSKFKPLVALNHGALSDRRVHVHNQDALKFLEHSDRRYDVIIIDLPDPNNEALGKLYSRSFYRLVAKHLSPVGLMVTQATSPFFATNAYWCVVNTIEASDIASGGPTLKSLPYRASVPSFGEWGFVIAAMRPLRPEMIKLRVPTRFLTPSVTQTLFTWPKDIGYRKTPINRLDNQILVQLYEKDYKRFNR